MEPTYRIAQRLHERRAAVGLPKYGQPLSAASPGCMLVHALEEAADLTEYLLTEVQRRREAIKTLCDLRTIHGGMVPDDDTVADISYVIDVLGGESMLARYDEILGTVAENATVAPDPSDEALRVAEAAREEVRRLAQANGDLRKERDRAVKEAQRQDGVAKGLRKERDQLSAQVERLRAVLVWLDRIGGLGLHVHARITAALSATPTQSLAAHDAALLRRLAAHSDPGERADILPWLLAEADRIEQEAKNK